MKNFRVNFLVCFVCFAGFVSPLFAQETLPEVVVKATRYKYLSAVDSKELADPVKVLERKAVEYDVKKSDYYTEEYGTYFISFYIPEGTMLATYDESGKIIQTAERYKDIAMPKTVLKAIAERFPGWRISKDIYLVNYMEDSGAKKVYKVTLQNGDKRMKVKLNELGEFL